MSKNPNFEAQSKQIDFNFPNKPSKTSILYEPISKQMPQFQNQQFEQYTPRYPLPHPIQVPTTIENPNLYIKNLNNPNQAYSLPTQQNCVYRVIQLSNK